MNTIPKAFDLALSPYKIGFVRPHSYLDETQAAKVSEAMAEEGGNDAREQYNRQMSSLIGRGRGLSYATGRMAFFSLMQEFGVAPGDEVLLLGFTCAAMPDAVSRMGATPVFADLDAATFGSGAEGIRKKITKKTKVVVAQHSFGIPCKIDEIAELCADRSIRLIEDCAITLSSTYRKKTVGNFGDASIFSTDHSKPLNTMMGGFFYTNDKGIYRGMESRYANAGELSLQHQKNLLSRFLHERKNYLPRQYPRTVLCEKMGRLAGRAMPGKKPLDYITDACPPRHRNDYPYPAKMPGFLCRLGLFELERWEKETKRRKLILKRYIEACGRSGKILVPGVYHEKEFGIVPLRFAFTSNECQKLRSGMSRYLDVDWIWFNEPIIGCQPSAFGYQQGSCPVSEKTCRGILNLPCAVDEEWDGVLLADFEASLKSL